MTKPKVHANTKKEREVEWLGSIDIGGELHAAFPTALRTLCLREVETFGELMKLRPNCVECLKVLRAWRGAHIEGSGIPKDWNIRGRGARA